MPQSSPIQAPQTREEHSPPLSAAQKRELVQRVVNSQTFTRSPALCAFLAFITDHEILGRVDKLKEQTIGAEVLGRKPNYDPADDNIVRVSAHELRGRPAKYFNSEGKEEPVVITIPRGAYVPEFVPRPPVPPGKEQPSEELPAAPPNPAELPAAHSTLPPRLRVLIAAALLGGHRRFGGHHPVHGQRPIPHRREPTRHQSQRLMGAVFR